MEPGGCLGYFEESCIFANVDTPLDGQFLLYKGREARKPLLVKEF